MGFGSLLLWQNYSVCARFEAEWDWRIHKMAASLYPSFHLFSLLLDLLEASMWVTCKSVQWVELVLWDPPTETSYIISACLL